jgi:hypothetical protein
VVRQAEALAIGRAFHGRATERFFSVALYEEYAR